MAMNSKTNLKNNRHRNYFLKAVPFLYVIIPVVLLLVYLSHLGFIPLDVESDEARRAVVSAEMMISKNYLTPTINGTLYLNKPPLYNWIIIGFFKLFDNYSMFAFRLPVIIAVVLTSLVIFLITKKYTNKKIAFFTALAYATNGRLLIYESLYGFIDTTFSLVAYANIVLIFYFGEKKKVTSLFIVTYILCAIAFLLKNIPALCFQAFSLITYFAFSKNLKKLFSLKHVAGIIIFLVILSSYYVPYLYYNHFSASKLFGNIVNESTKRTFIQYGFIKTIKHFFTFPFEVFYHFLPWTILVLALFKRNTSALIRQNRFMQYSILVFFANIWIYWFSVDVYPKYLFMLVPLIYSVLFYCYFMNEELRHSWQEKIIHILIIIFCVAIAIAVIAVPFLPFVFKTNFISVKILILAVAFLLCTVFALKTPYKLFALLIAFVCLRAGFNWFVVEQRGERFFAMKDWCRTICNITKGKELYLLQKTQANGFDGISFHISTQRNEILKSTTTLKSGAYYIADEKQFHQYSLKPVFHFINFPFRNSLYVAEYSPGKSVR